MHPLSIKKTFVATSLLLAFSQTSFAQEYQTISTMGVSNPVCDGGIETAEELQAYVSQNRADFVAIVENSGWNGDADALVEQIQAGNFEPTLLPTGTTFEWMGVRRRATGQADSVSKLRWGGDQPVDAFKLTAADANGDIYTFVIPKVCCNLAVLSEVMPAPVAEAIAEPAPAPIIAASPAVIPFIAPFIGYEDRVRDECPENPGEQHGTGHETENSGEIAGATLGLLKPLNDRTSLLAQLGGAYNFDDSTHSTLFADIGLNQKLGSRGFVGGGVGIWDINDSDNTDGSFFLQGGLDAFETKSGTGQWFAEARALFDEPGDNTIFMTGIRFLFDQ